MSVLWEPVVGVRMDFSKDEGTRIVADPPDGLGRVAHSLEEAAELGLIKLIETRPGHDGLSRHSLGSGSWWAFDAFPPSGHPVHPSGFVGFVTKYLDGWTLTPRIVR